MSSRSREQFIVVLALVLVIGEAGCTSSGRSEPSQSAQDQKLHDEAADAAQKARRESREAARQLESATRNLERQARDVASGARQGWNGNNGQPLDLNSATEAELVSLGITREAAARIVAGRPYTTKPELVERGILSREEYGAIESRVAVGPAKPRGRPELQMDGSSSPP